MHQWHDDVVHVFLAVPQQDRFSTRDRFIKGDHYLGIRPTQTFQFQFQLDFHVHIQSKLVRHTPVMGTHFLLEVSVPHVSHSGRYNNYICFNSVRFQCAHSEQAVIAHACHGHTLQLSLWQVNNYIFSIQLGFNVHIQSNLL